MEWETEGLVASAKVSLFHLYRKENNEERRVVSGRERRKKILRIWVWQKSKLRRFGSFLKRWKKKMRRDFEIYFYSKKHTRIKKTGLTGF